MREPAFQTNRREITRAGFTLIELLLVVATIAILSAILLPALAKAKDRAHTVGCLSNLKQLQLCFHLYGLDNGDFMPPNNFVFNLATLQAFPGNEGPSWCTNVAPYSADLAGISGGLLYPYNTAAGIYHCPADRSTIEMPDGTKLSQSRIRSYNLSQSINGLSYAGQISTYVPHYRKTTEIHKPTPVALFVFIDVHQDEIMDDQFGIPVEMDWWSPQVWWDVPANRHNQGGNFSFADGHAERWKWKVPKAVTVPRGYVQPLADGESDDFNRMESGFRQNFSD